MLRPQLMGQGRRSVPAPEGAFTYLEFHLDSINYNVRQCSMNTRPAAVTRRTAVHSDGDGLSHTRILRISWMLLFISLSYVIVTAGWIASENRSLLPLMELLTIWSAVAVLLLMVEIHRGAADAHRSGSLTAVLLTAAMAAVTISNHFLYLTVLPQLYPEGQMPPWLLLDGWPSITKGLECAAWALLLGLAMLFAATPARRLGRPVEWTLGSAARSPCRPGRTGHRQHEPLPAVHSGLLARVPARGARGHRAPPDRPRRQAAPDPTPCRAARVMTRR